MLKPEVPWDQDRRVYMPSARFKVELEFEAIRAPYFLSQPTTLYIYVDEKEVQNVEGSKDLKTISVDIAGLTPGEHRLAVDWASDFGPVAVGTAKFFVPGQSADKR